jgi:hypothetical protein
MYSLARDSELLNLKSTIVRLVLSLEFFCSIVYEMGEALISPDVA